MNEALNVCAPERTPTDFEKITYNLSSICNMYSNRLKGLKEVNNKLFGKGLTKGETISGKDSNIPNSFLDQVENLIIQLENIGKEMDENLETLYNKI